MTRTWAILGGWLAFTLAIFGVLSSASAQTVAVDEFKGRGSALVRTATIKSLREGDIDVVNSRDVEGAADRLGVSVGGGREQISGELGIAAWIEGEVERDGRNLAVTMAVIDASTGQTVGVMSYEARNSKLLAKRVQRSAARDLGDLIRQARAPARPEPPPVAESEPEPVRRAPVASEEDEEEDEEDEDEPADETETVDGERPAPLDLRLGFVAFSRNFTYKDDLSNLNTYDLPLGPSAQLELRWYPAAHFRGGVLAHLGIELRGAFAFGIDSELRGTAFSTSSRAVGAGLRGRVPLGEHELGALFGYGSQTFSVASGKEEGMTIDPEIPSASYSFLRAGAELRLNFDEVGLGLRAAYLPTFSSGEVQGQRWFPRADARGIEAQALVSYALTKPFAIEASFGWQRFAFTFNPKLDDVADGRPIAGGATDEYLSGTLGVRWLP